MLNANARRLYRLGSIVVCSRHVAESSIGGLEAKAIDEAEAAGLSCRGCELDEQLEILSRHTKTSGDPAVLLKLELIRELSFVDMRVFADASKKTFSAEEQHRWVEQGARNIIHQMAEEDGVSFEEMVVILENKRISRAEAVEILSRYDKDLQGLH
jgi:hypothetical protein